MKRNIVRQLMCLGILAIATHSDCSNPNRRGTVIDRDELAASFAGTKRATIEGSLDLQKIGDATRKLTIENGIPKFEIRNKMSVPVSVTLINQGYITETFLLTEKKRSLLGEGIASHQTKIDTDKQTKLFLSWSKPDGTVEKATYALPAGKYLYLSIEDGILKPQKGANGKTQNGLVIPKTNISQRELGIAKITDPNDPAGSSDDDYDDDTLAYDDE